MEPSSRFYTGEVGRVHGSRSPPSQSWISTKQVFHQVFKVLWSEPLGSGKGDMTDAETRSHMGQRFYVGIRRFIIVRTDEGHSTCV